MTNDKNYPKSLRDAMTSIRNIVNADEINYLRVTPLKEVLSSTHMTLGHRLRTELGLWTDSTEELFDDINNSMPNHLAVDADTASSALIEAFWHEIHSRILTSQVKL